MTTLLSKSRSNHLLMFVVALLFFAISSQATAQTRLKNICRVKGQEENTIQGIGLVTGLKGTGDTADSASTTQALVTAMRFLGSPVTPEMLAKPANIALVMVTATVPAAGARQGDQIDCTVSVIGDATSLAGGKLFPAPLTGPRTTGDQVFAFASGPIVIDGPQGPNAGKVIDGCRLEEDFRNAFHKDGKITLVLDKNKADFQVAQEIAERLNIQLSVENDVTEETLAQAIDQRNIIVSIPDAYLDNPVSFVSNIMEQPILEPETAARVVINRAANTVVVTGDTTIGAAAILHNNISVDTTGEPTQPSFVGVEAPEKQGAKLQALVNALKAVQVPPEDIADILLGLSRSGKLHAHVIIE